jgi:co-chaperonin GroES (HSP10)
MRAIGRYIAIEPIDEQLKSGVMILSGEEKEQQRFRKGKILSVGSEITDVLKKDDIVYYDRANSFELLIKDVPVTVIRQADVVAVEE